MIKYLFKVIWWVFLFFIFSPILIVTLTVLYIFAFLWDYKQGIHYIKNNPYSFSVGGEYDIIKTYRTPWDYLLNKKPIKQREGFYLKMMNDCIKKYGLK